MSTQRRKGPDALYDLAHRLQDEGYRVFALQAAPDSIYLHVEGPGGEEIGFVRFGQEPSLFKAVYWDFQPGDDPNEVLAAIRAAAAVKGLSA